MCDRTQRLCARDDPSRWDTKPQRSISNGLVRPWHKVRILHTLVYCRVCVPCFIQYQPAGTQSASLTPRRSTTKRTRSRQGSAELCLCSVEQRAASHCALLGVQHDVLLAMFRCSSFEEDRDAQKPVGRLYCVAAILGHLGVCNADMSLTMLIYRPTQLPHKSLYGVARSAGIRSCLEPTSWDPVNVDTCLEPSATKSC